MKKKLTLLSYLSLIFLLIIIALEVVIVNKHIFIKGLDMRKTDVFIAYFIHLPLFIFNLIIALKVLLYYFRIKFQDSFKCFYFILPSLIFYSSWLFYLIYTIIVKP